MSTAAKTTTWRMAFLAVVALSAAVARADSWLDPDTGYTWNYRITGEGAEICNGVSSSSVSPKPTGAVTIPSALGGVSVTGIGPDAFAWFTELTDVTIPDSVTSIEKGAFSGCGKLLSFVVADGNPSYRATSGLLLTKNGRELVAAPGGLATVMIPSSVASIGAYAFYGCSELANVTIPNSVTNIEDWAFTGCDKLAQFVVSDGNPSYKATSGLLLTKDGTELVAVPGSLTSVTIPDGVTRIGECAFAQCRGLASMAIPDGVTSVGPHAFSDCGDSLYDTTSVPGVRLVDGWAVGDTGALSGGLVLAGVRGIGDEAFAGCDGLTSVTVGDGVTRIGSSAFASCSSLASVAMPASVTDIGDGAFAGCSSLTSAAIPPAVTSIGECAFYGCSSLTSATIPGGVTRIGSHAFAGCSGLTSVTIPQCVCSSSLSAVFPSAYQTIATVVIADGVDNIGDTAFAGCSGLTSVAIPGGVTNIGNYAFANCSSLASVALPDSVTTIGEWAFEGCGSLASVALGGATSIGSYAFYGCENFAHATIPASVASIGTFAFYNCSALSQISFQGNAPVVDLHTFDAVAPGCTIDVRKGTTGWDVNIPGSWDGMTIVYAEDPKPGPDPDPPSPPEPAEGHVLYATVDGVAPATAAIEYNGYLVNETGVVGGTIQVKVGKPGKKDGLASVKATVVVGTKKVTLKGANKGKAAIASDGPTTIELSGGKGAEACEIVIGAEGLAGFYGAYAIDGARHFFTSKDKTEVNDANAILNKWLGPLMLIWDGGSLSVSLAKKGKAKVTGTLANGKTKVSGNAVFLIGETWCCVPVAVQKANLAFVLWLSYDGLTAAVDGLGGDVVVGRPGTLGANAAFHVPVEDALWEAIPGSVLTDYLPNGVSVTQKGSKWTLPKAGKVVYKNGAVDVSKLGENPAGLKLTYKAADSSFKGTFKVYADVKGKLKATTVNVAGFMVDGVGYGTATVKSKGSVAVTIE